MTDKEAYECPLGSGCNAGEDGGVWRTQKVQANVALQLLEQHVRFAHPTVNSSNTAGAALRPEKLVRPSIKIRDGVIDEESWEFFTHQWVTYKAQANLTIATKSHLESCLGDEITLVLFGRLGQQGWNDLSEESLLHEVKDMFVKKRNRMVNRLKLHSLMQGEDQPVQQYVATLKQVARTCQYTVKCPNSDCNGAVDYAQEIVLDQLVRGLNDTEIQRKVLSCKESEFTLDSVEKIIVAEESSKASQKESEACDKEGSFQHLAKLLGN